MKFKLFSEVALTRDFPEESLKAGDVATLADFVPHPSGGEDGCVLEVFNIEALSSDEILTVRLLAPTA